MTLQLKAALRGDLKPFLDKAAHGVQKGVVVAVTDTGKQVQADWRAVVNSRFSRSARVGGGNRRVANAIRLKVYDNPGASAAALVYSKFGRRGAGGEFVDYLLPHVVGATIRPTTSRWLYIPLTGGRRSRTSRLAVSQSANLVFIPLSGGRALLVRKSKTRSTPVALLVRQIRVSRTLDLDQAVARAGAVLPERLAANIERFTG